MLGLIPVVLIALCATFVVGTCMQIHGKLTSIEQTLHLFNQTESVKPAPAPHLVVVHTGTEPPVVAKGPGMVTTVHVPNTPPVGTA